MSQIKNEFDHDKRQTTGQTKTLTTVVPSCWTGRVVVNCLCCGCGSIAAEFVTIGLGIIGGLGGAGFTRRSTTYFAQSRHSLDFTLSITQSGETVFTTDNCALHRSYMNYKNNHISLQ